MANQWRQAGQEIHLGRNVLCTTFARHFLTVLQWVPRAQPTALYKDHRTLQPPVPPTPVHLCLSMTLPWVLAVLSLLPLLDAQSPTCTNYTVPITNATLDQISGKWFYIASAFHHPEYKELAKKFKASFFYMTPNHTEDTMWLREYATIGDSCIYETSHLTIFRENGTLLKYENGTGHFGHLMLPKDRRTFMLAAFPEDPQKIGLSFYADKPEVTQEQMEQFYEDLKCRGIDKSEVLYTDDKKDLCKPLEKQHEEERKKENERAKEDTALD